MEKPSIWKALFNKRMLICIFTGFSSGLPLYIVYQLIPAWLRTEGIDLKVIGLFALVGIPWTWKFLWSPLMDRYIPPFLGRRKGWALVTQIILLLIIACIGTLDPKVAIWPVVYFAVAVAFFSASQDIVLDAYRRELLPDEELGIGNSFFVNAYRVSSIIPGGLALILADRVPWSTVYLIVSLFMGVGILTTLLMPEPAKNIDPPRSLKEAIIEPFVEFFNRKGKLLALEILAFMFFYKLGDSMATALSTPFYIDMGFSMTEIGSIVKAVALWASIFGGFVGGIIIYKVGINKSLWAFGFVQITSILGFAILAEAGPVIWILVGVVLFEYLGVGLGTAAFVAFLARTTNKRFTATQFALFSSFIALPRTVANAGTGYIVEQIGWTYFFIFCTVIAIPGMLLLFRVAPWGEKNSS